ncbi:MAG: hypothetical protein K0S47_1509 [Herbinix sp.]|jgi:thiamine pyrophosphokinase|nr:hypothetical protein [Herbinix sp.]
MKQDTDQNAVLIITGGTIENEFLEKHLKEECYNMIIAVDRGLVAADALKLTLDFIVGDFDSVPPALFDQYKHVSTNIQTFPAEKDKTDTQIALELALMHQATKIVLVGATGNRLDHVLGNIHLLLLPMQLKVDAYIIDAKNKIYLKEESFSISKSMQYGDYVSLLPFSDQVKGLSLFGFKYPLDRIILLSGSSLGISNEIKEDQALIDFTEGILTVFETRD